MPLYTYKCKNCGKVVEKFHKMSVNGAEKCEDCGSETLRVFLPTGIIFKGSGFYSTDYKSGTSKANLNSGSQDGEKKEETRENKENREDSREKNREEKKEEHKTAQSASKSSEPKAQDKDKNTDKSKDKDKN